MPRKKKNGIEAGRESLERMLEVIGPYLPKGQQLRRAAPTDWRPTFDHYRQEAEPPGRRRRKKAKEADTTP